jgi:MOSC domain-containing protein YiiM
MQMILSLTVGLLRRVTFNGRTITIGIFKDHIAGPVKQVRLNLDGDTQSDLTVDGGYNKYWNMMMVI